MPTCYKICRILDNKPYSYNAYLDCEKEISLEYKIGEWRGPTIPNSLLFVFDTYQNAKDFCSKSITGWEQDFIIFQCECDELVDIEPVQLYPSTWFASESVVLKEYWSLSEEDRKLYQKINIPGTKGCRRLKLIKELSRS